MCQCATYKKVIGSCSIQLASKIVKISLRKYTFRGMNTLVAGFLGVVQGLTEFLPVSSSGHLVLFQKLIPSFSQPGITFDVILHFGTLFAVLFYFRKDLLKIKFRYLWFLGIGTIPALLVGVFARDWIEGMFDSGSTLWLEFLVSALVNYLIWKIIPKEGEVNTRNSFVTGIAQAIAIIPAISRSGATIFAGLVQGVKPQEAVKYSFLLSVPAILGANILELFSLSSQGMGTINIFDYSIGFLAAFISGFFAIKLVSKLLLNRKFLFFAIYCVVVAGVALLVD